MNNNKSQDDLHNRLGSLNIKFYKYIFFDHSQVILPDILSTYPQEWLMFYQKTKLYYDDPIIKYARTTVKPFAWSSLFSYLSNDEQGFFKLAKQYGIDDGYTFVINDGLGNSAFLNVMCDKTFDIDLSFFDVHRSELQLLLVDFYDVYLRQKKSIEYYRNRISLMISDKEKQVLALGCDGLKYKDIALELGIAERTVKFHVSNIVNKLGADSAKQAFLRAKELTII